MRPAFSLIVFTCLSGMGFGLAAVVGLVLPSSLLSLTTQAVLCFGLIGVGVAASTLHLGQPQRAWRAFSQWHTSWLSREAVLAVFTSGLLAVYFASHFAPHFASYFGDWVSRPLALLSSLLSAGQAWLGWVSAGFAVITVFATAMIYASLKPIALWHHPLTPVMFLAWALAGGILTATSIEAILSSTPMDLAPLAIVALLIAAVVKLLWWHWRRRCVSISSPESATGLGNFGAKQNQNQSQNQNQNQVRLLIPPHSEENWLQHEMGFIVARRHAKRLAAIAVLFAIIIPVIALLLYLTTETTPLILIPTTLTHIIGVMIDRWLFFAEAKHSVTLYYGERH